MKVTMAQRIVSIWNRMINAILPSQEESDRVIERFDRAFSQIRQIEEKRRDD